MCCREGAAARAPAGRAADPSRPYLLPHEEGRPGSRRRSVPAAPPAWGQTRTRSSVRRWGWRSELDRAAQCSARWRTPPQGGSIASDSGGHARSVHEGKPLEPSWDRSSPALAPEPPLPARKVPQCSKEVESPESGPRRADQWRPWDRQVPQHSRTPHRLPRPTSSTRSTRQQLGATTSAFASPRSRR